MVNTMGPGHGGGDGPEQAGAGAIYRSAGAARGRALSDPSCLRACLRPPHPGGQDSTLPGALCSSGTPPSPGSHPLIFSSNRPPLLLFLVFVTNDEVEVQKVK